MKLIVLTMTLLLSTLGYSRQIELTPYNTVILSDEINEHTVYKDIGDVLGHRLVVNEKDPVYVVIVSRGGEVHSGLRLIEFLRSLKNIELVCKYCASMAGALFEASQHPRLVMYKSVVLMHQMTVTLTAEDFNIFTENEVKKDNDFFNSFLYTPMKMKREDYEAKISKHKEWIVVGKDLVDIGLADELITTKCVPYIKMLLPDTCME